MAGGFGGSLHRQKDRGVAVLEIACGQEGLEPVKGRIGNGAVVLEHVLKLSCRPFQRLGRLPEDRVTKNGGGGLTEGAGLDLLAEAAHAAIGKVEIDGNRRPTQGRAFSDAGLGGLEPPEMGDIRRKRKNACRIQLDQIGGFRHFRRSLAARKDIGHAV